MQNIELFVSATLCIASEVFHSSTRNSNPASVVIIMVCNQNRIHNHLSSC